MTITFGQDAICRHHNIARYCVSCNPYRTTDPETSKAAARSVNVADGKRHVLSCLIAYGPQTDAQLEERLYPTLSRSGVRTRRNELVVDGLVAWTGRTETLGSGRSARVWAAVPNAFDLVESASDRGKRSPIEYSAQRGPSSVLTSPAGAASHLGGS